MKGNGSERESPSHLEKVNKHLQMPRRANNHMQTIYVRYINPKMHNKNWEPLVVIMQTICSPLNKGSNIVDCLVSLCCKKLQNFLYWCPPNTTTIIENEKSDTSYIPPSRTTPPTVNLTHRSP